MQTSLRILDFHSLHDFLSAGSAAVETDSKKRFTASAMRLNFALNMKMSNCKTKEISKLLLMSRVFIAIKFESGNKGNKEERKKGHNEGRDYRKNRINYVM